MKNDRNGHQFRYFRIEAIRNSLKEWIFCNSNDGESKKKKMYFSYNRNDWDSKQKMGMSGWYSPRVSYL